ncbi:hypothetical protein [Paracidovorax cattleyae]|uniref:hypothetical protein n=1 Tax=Paracidovorax cattleyae TaxID=80868 RepID=UPI0018AF8A2C|nr:hypothetical protein [Paracidovorax cattleyae]MBF9263398.1 hypothetical protein [Paracidovorax cattleyae]
MASAVRQIGIKMMVDAQSVTTELPKAAREFERLGTTAEGAAARTTRSLANVQMSVRDVVAGAAGLHLVSAGLSAIGNAVSALPRMGFGFAREIEVAQVGMAGILGSMTAINGQQTDYNTALRISSEYIRKLNDDALRTAASSQELTQVFQALLAPGLSARMTLEEIRQLTVVGTNAVKSMGLDAGQVIQELRDLVAGGITPASSQLAGALGLKDSDIARAKASSEGLFSFLMQRLQGFKASSEAFGETFKGRLDSLQEGMTRVAAAGLEPLIAASKEAIGEVAKLFVTIEQGGNVTPNQALVDGIREYAASAAQAMTIAQEWLRVVWDNRDAAIALGAVWASIKIGGMVADIVAATAAKVEMAQASRLAAAQAAAEAASNAEVTVSSRAKVAAYLAELQAQVATAQAEVAAQTTRLATLAAAKEGIEISRAEVLAKLDATRQTIAQMEAQLGATRATMAQAEAQLAAARSAGALSYALAAAREATAALNATQAQQVLLTADLNAAQARHALLMTELAALGRQQAGVQAAVTAATAAQTAATAAATAATGTLTAAQGAASIAGRALSGVLGFLGGPIGAITTVLTLGATAWALWGTSGAQAEQRVQGAVERSTPQIIADLNKQIDTLGKRNALAAAGLGDLAKRGNEATDRLAELQSQIDDLKGGKGIDGGAPLPEAARVDLLQKLLVQYGTLAGAIQRADEAQAKLNGGSQQLTLTVTGAEQAWRKATDGIKTAASIQEDYTNKLQASKQAWDTYRDTLMKSGASKEVIEQKAKEQAQVEASLAATRDKQIKELGASAAQAREHGLDAEIAAVQRGYKLLAAKTADGLHEIESLHQQARLSDYDAIRRKADLQVQDIEAQETALRAELKLARGKKESLKEQANLVGQLAELEQKRQNIQRQAGRDMETVLLKPQLEQIKAMEQATDATLHQAEALEAQNKVYGLGAVALEDLIIAQLEKSRLDLEATDNVIPGAIEAIERQIAAHKRLRAAMADKQSKDLAKEQADAAVQANESARKAIERENEQLAQSLADNIMRGGKSAADYLEDTFRTLVLRPIISAIIAPVSGIISGIANSIMGGSGGAGVVGGAGYSAGGILSIGRNIYSAITGGFQALSGQIATQVQSGLNFLTGSGGMISQGPIQVGGIANGVGLAGSYLAGAGIGRMAGQIISGGYSAFGSSGNTAVNAGTIIGSIFGGPMGGAIGGAIGGLVNRVFGRKLKDTGIEGTFGGDNGFEGQYYQFYKGGFLRSNKTKYSELDEQTRKQLADTFTGLRDGIKDMGKVLGLGGEALENFTQRVKVSLHGLSAEDAQKRLQEEFEKIGIRMADLILGLPTTIEEAASDRRYLFGVNPDASTAAVDPVAEKNAEAFKQLQKAGETSLDTLTRLATSLATTNGVFETLGQTAYAASLAGGDMASKLIDVFGGVEKFTAATGDYFQKFYSATEQRDAMRRTLEQQLAEVDLKLPDINADNAREQYRKLAEAQDRSTESGRKAYAVLIQLAGSFDQIAISADTRRGLEERLLIAQGKDREVVELRRKQEHEALAKLDPSLAKLVEQIYMLEDASAAAAQAQVIEDKRRDLEQRLLTAQGKDRQALDLRRLQEYNALLKLDPALAAMVMEIYKAEDAATAAAQAEEARRKVEEDRKAATDRAYAAVEKSISAARDAAQAEIELREARVAASKELVNLARTQARELRGQVESTAAMQAADGRAVIEQTIAALRSGQAVDDNNRVSQAITAARGGIVTSDYSNRLDFEAAQLVLANKLDVVGDLGAAQLSTDELLLRTAKGEVERLDKLLQAQKDALDMARGTYVATLDNGTAIREFQAALLAERGGAASGSSGAGGSGATGSNSGGAVWGGTAPVDPNAMQMKPEMVAPKYFDLQYLGTAGIGRVGITSAAITARLDALAPIYHKFDDTGDLAGLFAAMEKAGATVRDFARIGGFWESDVIKARDSVGSKLPAFAVGINRVPYDMTARIHEGEAVLPAKFNPFNPQAQMPWGAQDNGEIVRAVQALQQQQYDLLRAVLDKLGSVDTTTRKLDALGIKQRAEATV